MMWIAFVILLALPPETASHVGACLAARCELGTALARVSRRESRGRRVGIHERDARWSRRARRKAQRRGIIASWCPALWWRGGWSSRGVHGLMAAYSLHYLGPCVPPPVLDIPVVSAFVATRRASSKRCDRHPRCRSWRGDA